ncbi:MAG: DUF4331 domain-containing protein [Myxococcales bacterium]|nr:DUF4331 domain-containing protein [Myxococcales bacterium]
MRRKWVTVLGVLGAIGLAAPLAQAADHLDGPGAVGLVDKSGDIADVYAWMSPDASKVYLVMDVGADTKVGEKFSDKVKYVFNVVSRAGFADVLTGKPPIDVSKVICTFDAAQVASCWVFDAKGMKVVDYVTGDAKATTGIESASKKMKLFAGVRNDPFFFNLEGFRDAVKYVQGGKGLMDKPFTLDGAGCPTNVDPAAATKVLKSTAGGTAGAKDFFAKFNVLSIVIAMDKGLLTADAAKAPVLGVYGSTHK